MKTKMLTLRIPIETHEYLSRVAEIQKSTIQNLCQVLLMSCVQGMAKRDKEELEKWGIKEVEESE